MGTRKRSEYAGCRSTFEADAVCKDDSVHMVARKDGLDDAGGQSTVFLVWAPHSERAKGLSERLDAQLFFMSYGFRSKMAAPIKYPLLFLRSLVLLNRQKPGIVICQAPPIFCPLAALTYGLIHRKTKVVIDLHSGALEKPWSYLKALNTTVMKRALAVLVSNKEAYDHVLKENGTRSFVLEDIIPRFHLDRSPGDKDSRKGRFGPELTIAIPSSFASDEPIREILQAAAELPRAKFYLTGDISKAGDNVLREKPENVVFTGFLNREDYVRLLDSSDAVMVLTTRDMTLLAGAYDAVSLGKALITSNWTPLTRYFHKGTIHVDNSSGDIVKAIRTVQTKKAELEREMDLLRDEKTKEWEVAFARFQAALG